jgi:hypothetical protein
MLKYSNFLWHISDLGESSANWWHEELETNKAHTTSADNEDSNFTSNVRDCGSPVFKTPQFGSKNKKNKRSYGKHLSALSGQKRSTGEFYFTEVHGIQCSCKNYVLLWLLS